MTTTRSTPSLDLPPENELSRAYLRLLEAWLPHAEGFFAPWPERPGCGHFLSGAHWYGLETVGPAFALAAAAASPELDEAAAGVSPQRLREMALAGVRYLCFTHDTGPADCVRPATGLGNEATFGTKWGERGLGYFRESQCGRTTGPLVAACRLLGDAVDDETAAMVTAMQRDYLERFGDMPPRSGVYLDTQMEENGWTAEGLTGALMFLGSEAPADVEANARRWMFSTCAAPQDAKDGGPMGGDTVARATGKTVTALPDYWAENHGMVHPSYTESGVRFTLYIGNLLGLWGRDLPAELLWNRDRVYANLKALTDEGGYVQPVQGMDWPYLPALSNEAMHAVAAVLFGDPEAAALERRAIRLAGLRLAGNAGRLVNPEVAAKTREADRATVLREAGIAEAAQLYLFHRLFGPGAEPVPETELPARLAGVRHFPHAGFVHHRHGRGQTSISWRNATMALPLTAEGIYTIAPASGSWLARPEVNGCPDSQHLRSLHVDERDDRVAVAFTMDRCQDALRQEVLFASLPDGRALSWERVRANRACELASLEQGFLRITNETFAGLDNGCRGERVLTTAAGTTTYRGWVGSGPEDDVVDGLGTPAWVNVDGRLGVRLVGSGRAEYRNRHFWTAYQVVADDLVLSLREPGALAEGEVAGTLAALLTPGQTAAATAATSLAMLEAGDAVALMAAGWLLACRCAAEPGGVGAAAADGDAGPAPCSFEVAASQLGGTAGAEPGGGMVQVAVPVFAGATLAVTADGVTCQVHLEPGRPRLLRAVAQVQLTGTCRLEATATAVYVTGTGRGCEVAGEDGATRPVAAGDTVCLETAAAR